jgi:hypothetical protein
VVCLYAPCLSLNACCLLVVCRQQAGERLVASRSLRALLCSGVSPRLPRTQPLALILPHPAIWTQRLCTDFLNVWSIRRWASSCRCSSSWSCWSQWPSTSCESESTLTFQKWVAAPI